jgi:hypothetical protein
MTALFTRIIGLLPGSGSGSGDLVALDANDLIRSFGDLAYEEARTRAREESLGWVLNLNRPIGHWDRVRREIARLTRKSVGLDTATRFLSKE